MSTVLRRPEVRKDRHESFTQGLQCEPLLAVPVSLVLLALVTFLVAGFEGAASTPESRWWLAVCTVCIVGHCVFMVCYDSPRRLARRARHGCRHIAPRG